MTQYLKHNVFYPADSGDITTRVLQTAVYIFLLTAEAVKDSKEIRYCFH